MGIKTDSTRNSFLKASTLLVGAFFLAVPQAQAGGGSHEGHVGRGNGFKSQFREFRQENADLSKRVQKMMFRQQWQQNNHPGQMHILPYPLPWCPVPMPGYPRIAKGLDLDLTSELQNITLGKNLFSNTQDSVDITVGGVTRTLHAGDQVSAAEYVAARQKLAGNDQTVQIDGTGVAIGGEIDLGGLTDGNDVLRANSLVVSDNVTAYGDFGKKSDFRLFGDLENYGTVHTLSSGNNESGTVRALNISNYEGATISSEQDLHLHADWSLLNEGTISSDGSLTLTAGINVSNSGSISARNDVTVNSNLIDNQGAIASQTGNVNINASGFPAFLDPIDPPPYILVAGADYAGGIHSILPGGCVVYLDDINVNNEGGTISAEKGAINVRSSDYAGSGNTTITGGNLLSKELNLNSGNGSITVDVGNITGVINETGTAAHVSASTAELNIGKVCLTGDPTFYNSAGSINITNDITVSELLVIAASGNITSADNITIQAGDANQGFGITFIAGAAITPAAGPGSDTIPPGTVGAISLSGKASSTGGSIDLGGSVQVIARANTVSPLNENGADIEMFAFAGKTAGTGIVNINGTTLQTGGFGTGENGDVRIAAGASNTVAIRVGVIDTTGGTPTAGSGELYLVTAQPTTSIKGVPVNYSATGVRSGSMLVPSQKPSKGANIILSDTAALPDVDLAAGGFIAASGEIDIQGDIETALDWNLSAGTDINDGIFLLGQAPITAGTAINLQAGNDIGSVGNPFEVSAPAINAQAFGDNLFLVIRGSGSVLLEDIASNGILDIRANNRTVDTGAGAIGARNEVRISAFDYNALNFSEARNLVSIKSENTAGVNFAGASLGFTKQLDMDIAAGIGTAANPFQVESIDTVNLSTDDGAVFVDVVGKRAPVLNIEAEDDSRVRAEGSVILNDVFVSDGNFLGETAGRTLTVRDSVSAFIGITLDNSGTKGSSKIVFEEGSTVETFNNLTQGNIKISVGGGLPANNPGPFPNINIVETGGTVTVNGPGLKAKGDPSTLEAKGADIDINNGLNAGNISFGGNVLILADPPVAAGTPTFVTEGPVKLFGQNSNDTAFGASSGSLPAVSGKTDAQTINQTFSLSAEYQNSLSNLLTVNTMLETSLDALTLSTMSDDSHMLASETEKYSHDVSVYTDLDLGHGVASAHNSGGGNTAISIIDSMNHSTGIALYVPSKDMTVSTLSGIVKLNAGSMALVSAGRDHLSVYNLHDEKSGGVIVETAGRSISLLPGRHACIASEKANAFADLNPIEVIPHRSVSRKDLGNGQTVFQSEFSLLSAAEAIKPLKSILTSKHAGAKKVAQRMLKTTAVVMHMSGATPYEFHVKPRTVALRK